MKLKAVFNYCNSIILYNDGQKKEFFKGDEEYSTILAEWKNLLSNSLEMPAFGVSLDRLTREDMKTGTWIEFIYAKKWEYADLPFEKLLINADERFAGVNVIRYEKERGYSGRCFYIDLTNGKTLKIISDFIKNIWE